MLITGDTGTGKTVNISTLLQVSCVREYLVSPVWLSCPNLQHEMEESFLALTMSFSARTSVNQVQDRIDSNMEKRQRGTYGPTAGSTFVVFVDDLNLPERETFGGQPPLELLRQVCD